MYICLCNNVNDTQIRGAVAQGASSLDDLRDALGVASQCGQCACMAEEVLACEQQRLGLFYNAGRQGHRAGQTRDMAATNALA